MEKVKYMLLAALMLLTGGVLTTSCTDYQDEIDALDYRITVLEKLVKDLNNNIEAMKVIVTAMEEGDYITAVNETEEGYLVNFHKAGPIYIIDGVDGEDAQAPDITVVKDPTDGQWYWQINGEWLLVGGEKIRANGKDGENGKDAISPQVRINQETGIWEVSTDGGLTWTSTGTPAKGKDGENGENGKDGRQFFMEVNYTIDGNGNEYMVITTKSGQTFRIPIYTNN